jgi:predicted P-loop ATPase
VESNYVPDYDPIYDYLHALPQWDGRDRVTDVAYRVPTDDDGWARYFHTWMLAMVNQWSGGDRIYGNSMVPLLVGSQGDGKSTFCKRILPPELHDYYAERLDFSNRNEAERALTRFALINIDEYDSITPRQGTFLKHILQKSSVMSRKLYQSVTTERQRYSAFIGTTNDPTPLTDPTGSRRYLCIKTTGTIDNDTPIDYPQLYAQLMAELKRGDRDYFSTEEETKIQRRNVEFQEFDSVEEIFSELFRKPEEADEGHFVNVMAILKTMKQKYPIIREDRKTAMLVGKMLKRKGFVGKHSIAGTRYNVVAR